EILQFLAKPIPFCRFCNLAKWQSIGEWKTSKKDISEYLES
ncbi:MAG: radical SAM protein, partial [Helicobacter sp.]|nr:radical SAM protein [Helicobacter sp.]